MRPDNFQVQESTGGPIAPHPLGWTWRDHLAMAVLFALLFLASAVLVYYNLTLLYRFNPGYGRDLAAEEAFCAEVDRQIVSSVYAWDPETLECRVIDAAARMGGDGE